MRTLIRILENLGELECRTAEFYNIATRSPLCIDDVIALNHFNTKMWEQFIDISHTINVSDATPKKVLELLETYKNRKDILKDTTHAIHLANTWINSIKDCELGKGSEVARGQWMELLISAVSDSLDEIRAFKDWLDTTIELRKIAPTDNKEAENAD